MVLYLQPFRAGHGYYFSIRRRESNRNGTFSFVAVREVDDGSGGTTTETVVITERVCSMPLILMFLAVGTA